MNIICGFLDNYFQVKTEGIGSLAAIIRFNHSK